MEKKNVTLTIVVDEEIVTIEMSQNENILEAALKNNVDAPYSCQGGVCSSCIARVTEGKATMALNQILTENEVSEGLILTCQAHPVSEILAIDYDDV
jgi:ring-1,2-phenylacetyl-CoA epoxidase subunit PaaE|tara:strand:+ start:3940 stop:4230 length:291 start_codon:yes stop_codon:yes gene_type:complete